jgi:DNA modification methylase
MIPDSLRKYVYYDEPDIVLLHGDCLDILPHFEPNSIDLVLTDPPYGVKRDKGFEGFEGFGGFGKPIARKRFGDDNWDSDRPTPEIFNHMLNTSQNAIIWGGNFFADILPRSTHWIFWDKLQTMPTFGDGELAWTNSKRKSIKKITIEYNGLLGKEKNRQHPTQKPLDLMLWCIDSYLQPIGLILDPFLGSGTTAVACKQLGRKCIGIEIESKYLDIAIERLRQEVLF